MAIWTHISPVSNYCIVYFVIALFSILAKQNTCTFCCNNSCHWKAITNSFCQSNNVRDYIMCLKSPEMAACPSKSCLYLSKEKFREIPITFSHFTKWFLFLVFLLLLICIKLQLYLELSSIRILIQMVLHKILFIVTGFFFHIWRRYHVTMS